MVELILRWCVLIPIGVSLMLLLPALKPWRNRAADAGASGADESQPLMVSGAWMVPIALAVVSMLTHLGMRQNWQLALPPLDAKLYLAYFMPVVAAVALLGGAKWSRWWMRLFAAGVLYRYYFPLLLGKMFSASPPGGGAMIWLIGLMVGGVALTGVLDAVARRWSARLFVFGLGMYVALSAALFSLMGSLTAGYQCGGVATFLGVFFLLLLWKREAKEWQEVGGLGVLVAFILIGNGSEVYFFSYAVAPFVPLLLWLSVPILWWLAAEFFAGKLAARPGLRVLVFTMIVLVPMSSAGMVVYRANQADASEFGDDYSYDEDDW